MEFNEKLQQLRKQNTLTQEDLARQLFVSRTAVSKWESGKGYPNIDSLKAISKLFSISIDNLLCEQELIAITTSKDRSNIKKIFNLLYGILDAIAVIFILFPFFGQLGGTFVHSVPLLQYHQSTAMILLVYWMILLLIILLGITQIIAAFFADEKWRSIGSRCSLILNVIAILIFTATREPQVVTFLFVFLIIKIFVLIKEISIQ